jgi:hypothetical protein
MKNELNTRFEQNFTTDSYRVGIGRAWCSWKACEICSSLVQKKKNLEFFNFSSHKLPKQQSTSFWSQGILGIKVVFLKLGLSQFREYAKNGHIVEEMYCSKVEMYTSYRSC